MEFNTSLIEYVIWALVVLVVIVLLVLLFFRVLFSVAAKYDMSMDELLKIKKG